MSILHVKLGPELSVSPLCLGGNVFGWTAGEADSREVLDAYVAFGANFIDTSDSYSFWAPGNSGGESEKLIGGWLTGRSDRDDLVIATKVSQHPDFKGLAPNTIRAAVDSSLSRLGVDHVDLYYAHFDDPETPLEYSVEAMSSLVDAGKVRALGLSNYSTARIRQWLRICDEGNFHRPVVLQPQYSLMERGIEVEFLPMAKEEGLQVVPYYSLARGFLTGKYAAGTPVNSPRASIASEYLDKRGRDVLQAMADIAAAHRAHSASVAISWLLAQPGVAAPIASARNRQQLVPLLAALSLTLSGAEVDELNRASGEVM